MKMKNFLQYLVLISAGTLICTETSAQNFQLQEGYNVIKPQNAQNHVRFQIPLTNTNQQLKPTQTKSRLSSFATMYSDGENFVISDSSKLYFSKNRNSDWATQAIINNQYFFIDHSLEQPSFRGTNPVLNVDSSEAYEWEIFGFGEYGLHYKTTNTLGVTGNVLDATVKVFDSVNWYNQTKYSYTYDINNNKTSEVIQYWVDSAWKNNTKYIFEYNSKNEQTIEIEMAWDNAAEKWVNVRKENYDYNSTGKLISYVKQEWETIGGSWRNVQKWIMVYNGEIENSKTIQQWNVTSNKWVNQFWYDYSYNNKGWRTKEIFHTWISNKWNLDNKKTYQYDAEGNNTVMTSQFWQDDNWHSDYQQDYTYENNQLAQLIASSWDTNYYNFIWHTELAFKYNGANQCSEVAQYSWDADSIQWIHVINNPKIRFHYEEYESDEDGGNNNTGINNNIAANNWSVYPNPANDYIRVNTNNIKIYQLQIIDAVGKIVFENKEKLNSTEVNIPLGQLANGTYFLKVNNSSKAFVIKR